MMNESFDRHGSDGFVESRQLYYAAIIPSLRQAAFEKGYALALHGSLVKDLDLIAVPWVAEAVDSFRLASTLAERIGATITSQCTDMPHGRISFTIEMPRFGELVAPGYIDLSVMPTLPRKDS